MIKISSRTLDVYDDLDDMVVMRKIAGKLGDISLADPSEVAKLQDEQFGLVLKTASGSLMRRYPLHDTPSIKLSRAYFEEAKRDGLPSQIVNAVELKIAAAESRAGLRAEVKDAEKVASLVSYIRVEELNQPKVAAWEKKDEFYGLTLGTTQYFPLHTAELVKIAESRFTESSADLEAHERFVYARNIAKRAELLGVKIASNSVIHNYTAASLNQEALLHALDARRGILKSAGLDTTILDRLADAAGCRAQRGDIESADSFARRERKVAQKMGPEQIIEMLFGIDKVAGVSNYRYTKGLPDPYASCYKRADTSGAMLVDGVNLASVDKARLAAAFNDEFVTEFEADPVGVYRHLPDPVKATIREFAQPTVPSNTDASHGDAQGELNPAYTSQSGVSW